jgi:predicted membrane protein
MNGRRFFGFIFILVGIGFILQNLGVIDAMYYLKVYWPCLIILLMIAQMVTQKHGKIGNGIVILIFAFIQLRILNIISISIFKLFWPVVLILIGVSILFKRDRGSGGLTEGPVIHLFHIFSGGEYRYAGEIIEGGDVFTAFGGCDIDLRDIQFGKNPIEISATALFGGIDIIVPKDCKTVVKGLPILGGFSGPEVDFSQNSDRQIIVKVFVAFGGVDVKTK